MRYRDHRGSLADSLATERQIDSAKQLYAHLSAVAALGGQQVVAIDFHHVGLDNRTGWDTWHVLWRLTGDKRFSVVGMSDGLPPDCEVPDFNPTDKHWIAAIDCNTLTWESW